MLLTVHAVNSKIKSLLSFQPSQQSLTDKASTDFRLSTSDLNEIKIWIYKLVFKGTLFFIFAKAAFFFSSEGYNFDSVV